MTDVLTPEQRRACMAAIRDRDTEPEMIVRRLVHALGYRYALHKDALPGRPDLAFVSRRKAVFVHGCFWHGHRCARGSRVPQQNREYWIAKIQRNRRRDRTVLKELQSIGWRTLIVWECELRSMPALVGRITRFLE
jgi:DNA mismatch endonuclease (patch repair protein)